ncbi:uncharacterized protein [Nothobranchius furzeri]|uniref:uncharacterized protein isoform X1 n=1 Tax=Nothobranchius furzeri TaxID=105023 RepID=UPI003904917B
MSQCDNIPKAQRFLQASPTSSGNPKIWNQPQNVFNLSTKKRKVAQLVGKKCLVWCKMNKCKTQALWDMGAQVSIMSAHWKSVNLPDLEVHPISDLLSGNELLDLRAVNGSEVHFQGWVEVSLSLCDPKGKTSAQDEVLVPILISRDVMQKPIIGFNAIEELIKRDTTQSSESVSLLRNSLRVGSGKAGALLNLIHTSSSETVTYPIRSGRTAIVVPSGQMHGISCSIKTDSKVQSEMLFEPDGNLSLDEGLKFNSQLLLVSGKTRKAKIYVTNVTKHDIVLPAKTLIGNIERVTHTFPINLKKAQLGSVGEEDNSPSLPEEPWSPPVSLSHLNTEQQAAVMEMLKEESGAFAKHKEEIGHIKNLKMDIKLTDQIPVAKSYNAVPRALYDEVKNHIQDLFKKDFICKSTSSYASPVVCV